MIERIKAEPALVLGAVQTILGLILAFGIDLTNEQTGAILAVTAALLAIVTRSQVSPVSKVAELEELNYDGPNDPDAVYPPEPNLEGRHRGEV